MRQQAFSAPVPSLPALTTTGTGTPIPVNHCQRTIHVVQWSALTSAGAVIVESADRPDYAGAWTLETTLAWAAASSQSNFVLDKRVGAVRHRVSVNVVGGTINSNVQGEI